MGAERLSQDPFTTEKAQTPVMAFKTTWSQEVGIEIALHRKNLELGEDSSGQVKNGQERVADNSLSYCSLQLASFRWVVHGVGRFKQV